MKSRLINLAIIILVIMAIIIYTNLYLLLFNNYLTEKEFTPYDFGFELVILDITQEQAVELASECVGLKDFTIEYTSDLKSNIVGNSNLLTHHIKIKESLIPFQQLPVLVHEMVHIKYYTANERFTKFTAFKLMYESENEILHEAGKQYAQEICSQDGGEYDCSYYVVDYFQKKLYNNI